MKKGKTKTNHFKRPLWLKIDGIVFLVIFITIAAYAFMDYQKQRSNFLEQERFYNLHLSSLIAEIIQNSSTQKELKKVLWGINHLANGRAFVHHQITIATVNHRILFTDSKEEEPLANFKEKFQRKNIIQLDWKNNMMILTQPLTLPSWLQNSLPPEKEAYLFLQTNLYPLKQRLRKAIWLHVPHFGLTIIILLFAVHLILWRFVTRPLRRLHQEMASLEEGNWDVQVPQMGRDEIGELGVRFNEMASKLRITVENLIRTEKQIINPRPLLCIQKEINERVKRLTACCGLISEQLAHNDLNAAKIILNQIEDCLTQLNGMTMTPEESTSKSVEFLKPT